MRPPVHRPGRRAERDAAQEGDVEADAAITIAFRDRDRIAVADIMRLHVGRRATDDEDQDLLRRARVLPAMSGGWRDQLRDRLAVIDS